MPENTQSPRQYGSERVVGLRERIAYAAGDTASVLYFKTFSSFLLIFYTDAFGLSAAAVALMFFVTRTWDWINDPLMGVITDRTKNPNGKFRPWLRWMIIPLAIAGIALFTVPDLSDGGKLVYAYVTYTLVGMFYTAINIPYGALMGVMTPYSEERTILSSFRFYGAYLGNLIVTSTLLIFVANFGGEQGGGHQKAMMIYAALASVLFLFTYYGTRERVQPPASQTSNTREDLKILIRTRPWLSMIFVGIVTIIWIAVRDSVVLYYFKYYIGDTVVLTTWFNVLGTVALLGGVALTSWYTRVLGGKRNAFIILTLSVAFVSLGYYFAGPEDIAFIFTIQVIGGIFSGPLMPLFWAMIADTADYAEWKYGRRFTGLVFSGGNLSQKLGWTIGPVVAISLLSFYGYEANVEQTPEMLYVLKLMISLIPIGIAVVAALVTLTYGIDRKLRLKIERELALRKTGDASLDMSE